MPQTTLIVEHFCNGNDHGGPDRALLDQWITWAASCRGMVNVAGRSARSLAGV